MIFMTSLAFQVQQMNRRIGLLSQVLPDPGPEIPGIMYKQLAKCEPREQAEV